MAANLVTWVHLSDWHDPGPGQFDREVVRDGLIDDLGRREELDPALADIDFVVFSGDIAFSGTEPEFSAARDHLLDPVLGALDLGPDKLFAIPGNHDLDRSAFKLLPAALAQPLTGEDEIQYWLTDDEARAAMLRPFRAFTEFVAGYTGQSDAVYASVRRIEAAGRPIALVGLNSALMCGRTENDYGNLVLGEPQLVTALKALEDDDVAIAAIHHPLPWLTPVDRDRVKRRLGTRYSFILHGHEHEPSIRVEAGSEGDHVVIPAGASYERRSPTAQRFANAYTLVRLDLERNRGVVYLRSWNDVRSEWVAGADRYDGGHYELELPDRLRSRRPTSAPASTGETNEEPALDRTVIEPYLAALIRESADIEPGGIKQTKQTLVLPLDEVYLSLQANKDRPDVDRRVMREDLEEINRRLEQLSEPSDPDMLERQRSILAEQTRALAQAAEHDEPPEDLPGIVRRRRQVVILGDPGSGKTTLLRYLALHFARACLEQPDALIADLGTGADLQTLEDIGPIRFPILLRISHYSEARQRDRDLALMDYLPRYFAGLQVPHADRLGPIFQSLLEQGRCIVLLDGLDEIIDPVDRRNIANAIGQFVGAYRERGLPAPEPESRPSPARLARSLASAGPSEGQRGGATAVLERRVRRGIDRRLDEERYAHMGNHFVITSRIAGYHSAEVPGAFEHFTIRDMDSEQVRMFLERWCHAVERHIARDADPLQVEQRARREIAGIMDAIERAPGVRRLASNPLLLRILAIVHRDEAHLPQRRAELYETAAITLLRDWSLAQGAQGRVIDEAEAKRMLGPLAFHIHETRPTGLLTLGETTQLLCRIRAEERGEDPDAPSATTERSVADFLETVRQHSGLFVERGDGLYGFMHLTFEEYFAARELMRNSRRARDLILDRLHLPRWREPILLAVGILSENLADDAAELLAELRDANSEHEALLHRDLLFVADCIGDSVNVVPGIRRDVAHRLLELWCDARAGRYALLREQVRHALRTLATEQRRTPVELALADVLNADLDGHGLRAALETVEMIQARSPAVADALKRRVAGVGGFHARELLRNVSARGAAAGEGDPAEGVGWQLYAGNERLAELLAALWLSGWNRRLIEHLGVGEAARGEIERSSGLLQTAESIELAEALLRRLREPPPHDRDWYAAVSEDAETFYAKTPWKSPLEAAASRIRDALPYDGDGGGDEGDALATAAVELEEVIAAERPAALAAEPTAVRREIGYAILTCATRGQTLASSLAAVAAKQADVLRRIAESRSETAGADTDALKEGVVDRLHETVLQSGDDVEYVEAALFLLSASTRDWYWAVEASIEARSRTATLDAIFADLALGRRRRPALEALRRGAGGGIFEPERRALLTGALEGPVDEAEAALEVLLNDVLDPELLGRCWTILSDEKHPLAATVREQLGGRWVRWVPGTAEHLAQLDAGLRGERTRPVALELLRGVEWDGRATLSWMLRWLAGDDEQARAQAAILLGSRPDPYADLRQILSPLGTEGEHPFDWADLADDRKLVRLLAGLWVRGWDDGFAHHWFGETARSVLDYRYSDGGWFGARDQASAEQAVMWMLRETMHAIAGAAALAEALRQAATELPDTDSEPRPFLDSATTDAACHVIERLVDEAPELFGCLPRESVRRLLADPKSRLAALAAPATAQSPGRTPGELAEWLDDPDPDRRRAAAIVLMSTDLDSLIVPVLLDAEASTDDWTRATARRRLYQVSEHLWLDAASPLAELLPGSLEDEATSGSRRTLLASLLINAEHRGPDLILRWLDDETPLVLGWVSEEIEDALGRVVRDPEEPAGRRSRALDVLTEVGRETGNRPVGTSAIVGLLASDDVDLRRMAAFALQWTSVTQALEVAQALLETAWTDDEEETRAWALGSAGRLIGAVRRAGDLNVTPVQAAEWIDDRLGGSRSALADRLRAAASAEAVVSVSDEFVADLSSRDEDESAAAEVDSDVAAAAAALREEWGERLAAVERRRQAEPLLENVRRFLDEGDPRLSRAAACAFARALDGDPDVPLVLSELLPGPRDVLSALVAAAADRRFRAVDETLAEARIIAGWIQDQDAGTRRELIDCLVDRLDEALARRARDEEPGGPEDELAGAELGSPLRTVIMATLGELSERLTPRAFLRRRELGEVIDVFVRAGQDLDDWQTRLSALRALGNLQTLTAGVVDVLTQACRDEQAVYAEARTAVSRFNRFGTGTLAKLTEAVQHESTAVARHAALLLAGLGVHRSEELGAGGRSEIADKLVHLLERPGSDDLVYEFEDSEPRPMGPLYDVIFETIARVVDPNLVLPSPAVGSYVGTTS